MRITVTVVLIIICCLPLLTDKASAGGPVHGARAAGMGTAYIGVAEGPSAIAHNPAGLTQGKGTRFYNGVVALTIDSRYEDHSGNTEETEKQFFFPPHLYIASDFGTEKFDFGIGLHSIYGIGGRKWDRGGLTRYQSTEANIATFTFNPTVAWEAAPWLSIGVGADFMYVRNDAEKMVDQSASGAGDGRMTLEAEGFGVGFNVGFLMRISESVRLGIQYRSETDVNLEGELEIRGIAPALQPLFGGSSFKTDVESSSTFPEIYGVGIAYQKEKLTVAVDVEVVRWSSFDREDIDLDREVPAAGVTDSKQVFDWKDAWQYKAGIEYRATDRLALRTGYAFIESPVPEKTLDPGNPDADQHNISIGGGYAFAPWTVDVFYQIALFESRHVDNAILSGDYETVIQYSGLSVGYQF